MFNVGPFTIAIRAVELDLNSIGRYGNQPIAVGRMYFLGNTVMNEIGLVGAFQQGGLMRNGNDGMALSQASHGFANRLLAGGIQRARRLIKHYQCGAVNDCPGDRYPLPLPAREFSAAFTDNVIDPFGQFVYEL